MIDKALEPSPLPELKDRIARGEYRVAVDVVADAVLRRMRQRPEQHLFGLPEPSEAARGSSAVVAEAEPVQ